MEAIEALAAELGSLKSKPSAVALEVGAGQGADTAEFVRGAGYAEVEVRRDLAGHERVVVGR
jgi:methylase of polypeptide subunit release factors